MGWGWGGGLHALKYFRIPLIKEKEHKQRQAYADFKIVLKTFQYINMCFNCAIPFYNVLKNPKAQSGSQDLWAYRGRGPP